MLLRPLRFQLGETAVSPFHAGLCSLVFALVLGCGRDQRTHGPSDGPEANTAKKDPPSGIEPGRGSPQPTDPSSGGAENFSPLSPLDLAGAYEVHFLNIPVEAECLRLEKIHSLTILEDEGRVVVRYAPYLSHWRYLDTVMDQEPGSAEANVRFVDDSQARAIELAIGWAEDGPQNPGTVKLWNYCGEEKAEIELGFGLLPDTTPPEIHLSGWMEPDIAFSFTRLSFRFTEPLIWDGNDWPWSCVDGDSAASTLLRFTDDSGGEVPFSYDSIWGCRGVVFEQERVRGQTLNLQLQGHGRDLAGHPLVQGTREIKIRDPGLPQEQFDFSDGMPTGLQAIGSDASVYHVESGPPCEQGSCIVMETVAQRCPPGEVMAAAVLGIRVDHSNNQSLSVRHRIYSESDSAPRLGHQMQIPQTAFGYDDPIAFEADSDLDAPYTHVSAWLDLGLSHSSSDMGYIIAPDCWTGSEPPPRMRTVIDRITPFEN